MSNRESTVALSLLIQGEAVRLNRGKGQGDNYDFKYIRSQNGTILPYVSSQCFKKYWREALPQPYSPISRGKNAAGKEKNQVYTEGNPIDYIDDDLFGYMRAGANSEAEQSETTSDEVIAPEEAEAQAASLLFERDMVQDKVAFLKQFKAGKGEFYQRLRSRPAGLQGELDKAKDDYLSPLLDAMLESLNEAIQHPSESGYALKPAEQKAVQSGKTNLSEIVSEYIRNQFGKALQPTMPTTKRTSPIRMHALVAFSGIGLAKDFQTFARDTPYTGKNSVLNPNAVGIYSGWLKTRILIEGHRVGKFYLGENRDMVAQQIENISSDSPLRKTEINPYSRRQEQVEFVQMEESVCTQRIQQALRALTNIGNRQGPASGALHDGSLRPKGFIGAFMKCADSPFDAVWQGTDELPFLDVLKLKSMLLDWEDLFVSRIIYIGYPVEMHLSSQQIQENLLGSEMEAIAKLGFTFVVDTPRKALLKMIEDVAA